jgi:cobalt/nickel transport system permease protein
MLSAENLAPAVRLIRHPVTLAALAGLAGAAVLVERRMENAPEFPLGAFLGVVCVLGTTLLTGLVLLADGAERWGTFVSVVFLAHLPLALIEGLILGCTVGFLARVKPDMLGGVRWAERIGATPLLPLAVAGLLLSAGPARAHALEAKHTVDRDNRRVRVESWYETGDPPTKARVRVLRADGSVLAEGPLDEKGVFVFTYEQPEPLRVLVQEGGHRAESSISAEELSGLAPAATTEPRSRGRDLFVGVGFLLALASFVLSWLNMRRIQRLAERIERAAS